MDEIAISTDKKVVHLQFGTTSAGNYTLRLHQAFLKFGIDSSILSLHSSIKGDPRIQTVNKKARTISKINLKLQNFALRNQDKRLGYFNHSPFGPDISNHELIVKADIIYIHWVLGGFLSVDSLVKLAKLNRPLIFVIHDMWYLTGGCSYSFDCNKFLRSCNNCPLLPTHKKKDLSYFQFLDKLDFYEQFDNLFFVSPSYWLKELAEKSMLLKKKPIFRIPNPIDTTLFKPFSRSVAKTILNIDSATKVISFGANRITSPFKGWTYLLEALNIYKNLYKSDNVLLLIFGSGPNKEIEDSMPFPTRFMGYISDDYTTNLIYNASDVFVAPSLADNLPTTIIESLSCGSPVVGFKTGGIPEMIEHKINGYLADYKNSNQLAEGIDFCLSGNISGSLTGEYMTDCIIKQHFELFEYIGNK